MIGNYTHRVEMRNGERLFFGADEKRFYLGTRLRKILSIKSMTTSPSLINLTIRVVLADVINCWLPVPEWGLSSSVTKNTRLVAVFGAL